MTDSVASAAKTSETNSNSMAVASTSTASSTKTSDVNSYSSAFASTNITSSTSSVAVDGACSDPLLQNHTAKLEGMTTIICGDGIKFLCNKEKLMRDSHYFECMFSDEYQFKEQNASEVNIQKLDSADFAIILHYYELKTEDGESFLKSNLSPSLLETAQFYQFDSLIKEVLKSDVKNLKRNQHLSYWAILPMFDGGEDMRCLLNWHLTLDFLNQRNTEQFMQLEPSSLEDYLQEDTLAVNTEIDVFNALISWVEHDFAERRKHLDHLLINCLRWCLFTTPQLNIIKSHPVISSDLALLELVTKLEKEQIVPTSINAYKKNKKRRHCQSQVMCMLARTEISPPHYDMLEQESEKKTGEKSLRAAMIVMDVDNTSNATIISHILPVSLIDARGIQAFNMECVGCYVFFFGGLYRQANSKINSLNSIIRYDAYEKTWSSVAKLDVKFRQCCVVTCSFGNDIYVIGGIGLYRKHSQVFYVIRTEFGEVLDQISLPDAPEEIYRGTSTACFHRGCILLFAKKIYCYNIPQKQWKTLHVYSFEQEYAFNTAISIGEHVYLTGLLRNLYRFLCPDEALTATTVTTVELELLGCFKNDPRRSCLFYNTIRNAADTEDDGWVLQQYNLTTKSMSVFYDNIQDDSLDALIKDIDTHHGGQLFSLPKECMDRIDRQAPVGSGNRSVISSAVGEDCW